MTGSEKENLKTELQSKNINIKVHLEDIINQIEIFETGIPFIRLSRPCKIKDGIKLLGEDQKNIFREEYRKEVKNKSMLKFVPASGAASRMFSKLQATLSTDIPVNLERLKAETASGNESSKATLEFLQNIKKFAFYEDLKSKLSEKGSNLSDLILQEKFPEIIKYTIGEAGLNYANNPKGSVKFHNYVDGPRSAFEEHLVEALNYVWDDDGLAKIHFTISDEHFELVKSIISPAVKKFKEQNKILEVTYSFQKTFTDTIAVTVDNKPFKDENGNILFRPGGHGALLENLNELDADIIFIKNIDNVGPDYLKQETYDWKKILCGLLVSLQTKIFSYLEILEKSNVNEKLVVEIKKYCENQLEIILPDKFDKMNLPDKNECLFSELNRPIRVCGMVVNEGHPGGGPFWVKEKDGRISKQVIETTQVDLSDSTQQQILDAATHFSPVDFVCGIKSYRGEKFHLKDFVDPDSGLITIKSYGGKKLKALELPGLWNGGMAKWLSIFVEVPKITFTPVKEVNDLLKDVHQPQK